MTREELISFAKNFNPKLIEQALSEVQFTAPHYFRKTLHKFSDDIEVVLVCFGWLQSTSLHDHDGSECVVRVLSGNAMEYCYKPDVASLELVRTRRLVEGDIESIEPDLVHEVTNLHRIGTVFLNFYSPPLPVKTEEPAK